MKLNLLLAAALLFAFPAGAAMADPHFAPPPYPPAYPTATVAGSTQAPAVVASATPTPNTCGPVPDASSIVAAPATPAAPAAAPATPAARAPSSPSTVAGPAPQSLKGTAAAPQPAGSPAPAAKPAAPAAPVIPTLSEEVSKQCADGQVSVKVSARLYGYKIGDSILVKMVIQLKDGVQLDFDPLKQGKLALEQSFQQPFELAAAPVIVEQDTDGGKEYDLTLSVRNFVPSQWMTFSMQMPYSVAASPNGTPLWQALTTPKLVLLQYADGVPQMQRPITMGNTGLAVTRTPWALPEMAITVVVLFLTWPGVEIVRYVNRLRPRKVVPRDVAAWMAIRRVINSGKEIGYSANHYRRMDEVLRKFLSSTYPGIEGMTQTEIECLPDSYHSRCVKDTFRKLDRVLVEEVQLTAKEQKQLLWELDQLIERPYSV